ncbi:polyadenylate-binding protein 1A-like [Wyeomyia smithii]|uniref:polyadenylate-binding protein 1A-like n=1 Tax=Wyeomyia smithii TaxID=174621 RepID=UPI002467C2F1|nr:polyadenylate-binding protein 1A-like [Wyeomyia smithii]
MAKSHDRKFADKAGVFVQNLSKDIDERTLRDIFSVFGTIRSCEVVHQRNNSSCTFGFVHYQNENAVEGCIMALDGMILLDRKIKVQRAVTRDERYMQKLVCNVFVKNFGEELNNDSLKKLFEPYGSIVNHRVVTDKAGRSCGHGFVVFANSASAEKAIQALHGRILQCGKKLEVGCALKKGNQSDTKQLSQSDTKQLRQSDTEQLNTKQPEKRLDNSSMHSGYNLYINNLEKSIDNSGLLQMFQQFGKISSVRVIQNADGSSKGFGFVCLMSKEEAFKAISKMNGKQEGTKKLEVSLAHCKRDRKNKEDVKQLQPHSLYSLPSSATELTKQKDTTQLPTKRGNVPGSAAA